jgi:hypothetical protein
MVYLFSSGAPDDSARVAGIIGDLAPASHRSSGATDGKNGFQEDGLETQAHRLAHNF